MFEEQGQFAFFTASLLFLNLMTGMFSVKVPFFTLNLKTFIKKILWLYTMTFK